MSYQEGFLTVSIVIILSIAVLLGGGVVITREILDNKPSPLDNPALENTNQLFNDTTISSTTRATSSPLVTQNQNTTTTKDLGAETQEEPEPSSSPENDPEILENLDSTTKTVEETSIPEKPLDLPGQENLVEINSDNLPWSTFPFNQAWRDAVVNLICNDGTQQSLVSSGTGVIINKKGVVLTNAHVAVGFLFADWPTNKSAFDCVVRVGSPAYPLYRARLLYIGDYWTQRAIDDLYNTDVTYDDYPYGKEDYALLLISERTNKNDALPENFDYLPLYKGIVPSTNSFVYISGYPAGLFGPIIVTKNLSMISSPTNIYEIRSIENSGEADVFAFKGTIAGQHGSSGGAIIGKDGELLALPTFLDDDIGQTTDENVLNAITIEYINEDIKNKTGLNLLEFISQPNLFSVSEQFFRERGRAYQCAYAKKWKIQGFPVPDECNTL